MYKTLKMYTQQCNLQKQKLRYEQTGMRISATENKTNWHFSDINVLKGGKNYSSYMNCNFTC